MCVLMACDNGARLTTDEIRVSWRNNPDGAGFAFVKPDGRLATFRTLELPTFVEAYERATERYSDRCEFMVHFRFATHGTTDLANVHPFAQDTHTLVAHNGILPTPTTNDGRSDTRTFVQDYLPRLGATWFDNPEMLHLVSEYATGSKLVVLTNNPKAERRMYVVNEQDGHYSDDLTIWFSNSTYCDTRPTRSVSHYAWGRFDEHTPIVAQCELCGACTVMRDEYNDSEICHTCGTCQTCGGDTLDAREDYTCECQTFVPRTHAMDANEFALFHM